MAIRIYQGITPVVPVSAFVDEMALVTGDVTLGEDASIWPMSVARGDVHRIMIGARTNIQDGSVLHVTQPNRFTPDGHPLLIGNDVTVGHRVILHGCTVENFALIAIYKPTGKIPYVSAGFVGQIGVFTGMNAYGVGAGQIWSFSKEIALGNPGACRESLALLQSSATPQQSAGSCGLKPDQTDSG